MPTPYFTPLWAHEAGNLYGNRIPWEQKNTSGCWIGATNTMPGNNICVFIYNIYIYMLGGSKRILVVVGLVLLILCQVYIYLYRYIDI